MNRPGVRFGDGSALVASALLALQDAPQSGQALARRVFGLRQAPLGLSERLLNQLLGKDPRVSSDGNGFWKLVEETADRSVPLSDLHYAVVDVETTGGSPDRGGRIVDVAVVEFRDGEVVDRFSSLVDPGVPLSPWITRLTGITGEMLQAAPTFVEISDELRRRLEGRVFVAHNVCFDWNFVAAEMHRARSLFPSGPRLCTIRLTRRALPGLRRRGLDSVARYYDVPIESRHRALGDAAATAQVLARLLSEAERNGILAWDELQEWLRARRETRSDNGTGPRRAADAPGHTVGEPGGPADGIEGSAPAC